MPQMPRTTQTLLFDIEPKNEAQDEAKDEASSTTFIDNMRLPVHRWIRYSAGFSAAWVSSVIRVQSRTDGLRMFDPFAGSGTTLLASEQSGIESCGLEAHPFVVRMAQAKLDWRSDAERFSEFAKATTAHAREVTIDVNGYAPLIRNCYDEETLGSLHQLREAVHAVDDGSPASRLVWLALTGVLRKCSHAGTAQWQYVLPKKTKSAPQSPYSAFRHQVQMIYADMLHFADRTTPAAQLFSGDARTCGGISDQSVNLVVTSPPYPNNYDYADATRLEMSFFGELSSWGELQAKVRCHLLRSCSQHVPERAIDLEEILGHPVLQPIRDEISKVCHELAEVRLTKGGKKTYHLMVACYFLDLAQTWLALRRVCQSPSQICFVIGDSAPYGVYVPVVEWLKHLAIAAGFHSFRFERTRDRNVKWKNRKHRVPLCEGRLWVEG